ISAGSRLAALLSLVSTTLERKRRSIGFLQEQGRWIWWLMNVVTLEPMLMEMSSLDSKRPFGFVDTANVAVLTHLMELTSFDTSTVRSTRNAPQDSLVRVCSFIQLLCAGLCHVAPQ
ncbi:unnamed protein product, partial [Musa acuminata subsp. burmannicoides]